MSIVLSAKDVYKIYKTASGDAPALNEVSCELDQGLFYAIIGRSGSGKSSCTFSVAWTNPPATRCWTPRAGTYTA